METLVLKMLLIPKNFTLQTVIKILDKQEPKTRFRRLLCKLYVYAKIIRVFQLKLKFEAYEVV